MNKAILVFFSLLVLLNKSHSQKPNASLIEYQIDSLLTLSKSQISSKTLSYARSNQMAAEKFALEQSGPISRLWASCLVNKARIADFNEDLASEREYLMESIKLWENLGIDHLDRAAAYNNMGNLYHDHTKEYNKAIELYQKSLDVYRRLLTHYPKGFYNSLGNLGMAYSAIKKFPEAMECFSKTVEWYELNSPDFLNNYFNDAENLLKIYFEIGSTEKEELLYLRVLRHSENNLGPDHPISLSIKLSLSLFYKRNQALKRSSELTSELEFTKSSLLGNYYKHELATKLELLKTDPIYFADSLRSVAYEALENYEYRNALNALSGYVSLMLDHEKSLDISIQEYYHLAALLNFFSNTLEAEKLLKYTIKLIDKNSVVNEILLAECKEELATIYLNNNKSAEAIPLFIQAGEIWKNNYGVAHESYLNNLNTLGIANNNTLNYEESEKIYLEAIRLYKDSIKIVSTTSLGVNVNLANLYVDMKRLDDAEKLYLNTYQDFISIGDTTSSFFLNCLSNTIILFDKMQPREDMIPWYVRNAAMKKVRYGRETENYIKALVSVTDLLRDLGRYKEAEPYFMEQVEVSSMIGKEDISHLGLMVNQGSNFISSGSYEKAELVLIEAKKLFEEYNLTTHEYYPNCISNIGSLFLAKEETALGKEYLYKAIDLYEKYHHQGPNYGSALLNMIDFLPDSSKIERLDLNNKFIDWKYLKKDTLNVDFIKCVHNVAILCEELGDIERSIKNYLNVIQLYESLGLMSDIEYAGNLSNLASAYDKLYKLEEAEMYYKKALKCMEENNNTNHQFYAFCMFNMAGFYRKIGSNKLAKDYYNRIDEINNKAFLYDNKNNRIKLMTIGGFMLEIGEYDLAYEMMITADSLFITSGDTTGVVFVGNIVNFSNLCILAGDTNGALKNLLLAKNIIERYGLVDHTFYAKCLSSLSKIYQQTGKTELAVEMLEQSLHTIKKSQGEFSEEYMNNLDGLSQIEENLGHYSKAEEKMKASVIISSKLLENAANFMSESELGHYQKQIDGNVERLCSFITNRILSGVNYDIYSTILFDQLLVSKGFLQGVAQKINLETKKSPELSSLFSEFKELKSKLSAYYVGMLSEGDSVHVLEKKLEDIEKSLNRVVSKSITYRERVNWVEVRKSLKPGEAAIEFIHFRLENENGEDSTVYAANLIRPEFNFPVFIPICDEKKLNSEILISSSKGGEINPAVYRGIELPGYKIELSKLYSFLWRPLEKYLDSISVIYFAPAGLIHRMNLDAIIVDKETRLSDRYKMLRLSSTRLIGESSWVNSSEYNTASLYGGVEYDLDTSIIDSPRTKYNSLYLSNVMRGELLRDCNSSRKWDLLAGTLEEINQLSSILNANNFIVKKNSHKEANEESFKQLGKQGISPRVIHIATHGFFFPNPVDSSSRSIGLTMTKNQHMVKISDNPMIRSGLLLYGANYAWNNNRTYKPDLEDGILTAYEISQTNLSNTELVVLSACETGLGDIEGNEGVYGLQRAFKIAGARYLIMSLWPVPDQETSDFMIEFYKNWLEARMTIPDAFRKTQQDMRHRYPENPVSWAGFVLSE